MAATSGVGLKSGCDGKLGDCERGAWPDTITRRAATRNAFERDGSIVAAPSETTALDTARGNGWHAIYARLALGGSPKYSHSSTCIRSPLIRSFCESPKLSRRHGGDRRGRHDADACLRIFRCAGCGAKAALQDGSRRVLVPPGAPGEDHDVRGPHQDCR